MIDRQTILFTGGGGLLGGEVKKLLPEADYPTMDKFDITNYQQMSDYLQDKDFKTIIHAAAYTSVPGAQNNPEVVINANIVGTANITRLCIAYNIRLVYLSTDYVFAGERGMYSEKDDLNPVNKYAWSKLGGECAVRLYDNSLIIRTSFGENVFPYKKVFTDQWTSRQSVSVVAKKIVKIAQSDVLGIVHVGGPRVNILEYAKILNPDQDFEEISRTSLGVKIPKDTSLDTGKYDSFGL